MVRRRDRNYKTDPQNPLPEARHAADAAERSYGASGLDVARAGYRSLDRASPRRPYAPDRPGLARPVYDDGPAMDYDAGTRIGTLT